MKTVDVVLLHGWNLSKVTFAPLHDAFKNAGFRVHSLDFPGFGNEKAPDRPWHIVDYAEFLKRYFDTHHIQKAVVVGHSFGGRVALKFSQLYPSSVSSLILSGTPGLSPVLKRKMFFFLFSPKSVHLFFLFHRSLFFRIGQDDFCITHQDRESFLRRRARCDKHLKTSSQTICLSLCNLS